MTNRGMAHTMTIGMILMYIVFGLLMGGGSGCTANKSQEFSIDSVKERIDGNPILASVTSENGIAVFANVTIIVSQRGDDGQYRRFLTYSIQEYVLYELGHSNLTPDQIDITWVYKDGDTIIIDEFMAATGALLNKIRTYHENDAGLGSDAETATKSAMACGCFILRKVIQFIQQEVFTIMDAIKPDERTIPNCGKVRYTRKEAKNAVAAMRRKSKDKHSHGSCRRKRPGQARSYYCKHCLSYHITSQGKK